MLKVSQYFLLAQLVNWSQTPNNPTIGIAGENVTLKWKYSLNLVAGDTFDYFVIRRFAPSKFDFDDIVKYGIDGTVVVYNRFKGRFTLGKSATPELLLIKAKDTDEAKYCCKVYSKNDNAQNCVLLKILGKPIFCLFVFCAAWLALSRANCYQDSLLLLKPSSNRRNI